MLLLTFLEKILPEIVTRKIKLTRMVWKYPYHFSAYAKPAFASRLSPAEIRALKNGLDMESQQTIDRFLAIQKISSEPAMEMFPIVDLREVTSGNQEWLALQNSRRAECLARMPVLKKIGMDILSQTLLAHGLAVAKKAELEYLKGKDFIDAGAYCGESSCLMSEFSPGRIYAFEPVPAHRHKLQQTIRKINIRNQIRIFPYALGTHAETVQFNMAGEGASPTGERCLSGVEVQVRSLDSLLEDELKDANIGFIKADIEGMGKAMFDGMRETIRRFRPILSMAIYHSKEEFLGIKTDVEKYFPDYRIRILALDPGCISREIYLWAAPREVADSAQVGILQKRR